jgi:hypothetical protein
MKVTVENPRDRRLIERDGLGWSADAGLWMEEEPSERRVRRIFGRRLKG